MAYFTTFEAFDESTEDWKIYVERLEQVFQTHDVPDDKHVSALLSLVGAKTYKLIRSLTAPDVPSTKTFRQLVDLLQQHLHPKPLLIAERFRFHKRTQVEGETVQAYVAELKRLTENCEFGVFLSEVLRDRFVCGLNNEVIQKRLLTEAELTLQRAVEIAVSLETAAHDAEELHASDKKVCVNVVKRENSGENGRMYSGASGPSQNTKFSHFACFRCGNRNHSASQCRFRNEKCRLCNGLGHIMRVCPSREEGFGARQNSRSKLTQVREKAVRHLNDSDTEENNDYSLLSVKGGSSPPIFVPVCIEGQNISMELDTGAAVSVISEKDFLQKFKHLQLQQCDIRLSTYTGEKVVPKGQIDVSVVCFGKRVILKLYVVANGGHPLMGRDWLNEVQFDWTLLKAFQVNFVAEELRLDLILKKHEKVFSNELGTLKDFHATLYLKPDARPVFVKARSVPFALKPAIENELVRLEALGVITPVQFSDWATPVVPVVKKDQSVRLCGDYKVTVNPQLDIEQYPLPKPEELFASLSGYTHFCKIDLAAAYQQMRVDETTAKVLTLNTHKGLYRVNRLAFGVASAPALFERHMEQILQGCPGVVSFQDDILVGGAGEQNCLKNLDEALNRIEKFGLRVQKSKCDFLVRELEFLGHKISAQGLHASEVKVNTIISMPKPETVTQLRAFLGMVNYYGRFLPNLSTVLRPLHELLLKDTQPKWNESQDQAFKQVKELLTTAPVLIHYDPELELTLACDASAYGLGAVLSHVDKNGLERPIAFASRTLTVSEKGYAQIEKEALALIFGVKKFHQYIFGRKFILITDHEPLVKILGPKTGIPVLAAARLQRWALLLMAHSYDIRYRSTKKHCNADGLSRLPDVGVAPEDEDDTVEIFHFSQLDKMPVTHKIVAREVQKDPVLHQVLNQTLMGWTSTKDKVLLPYFNRRHELTIQSGCLLWGIRVVVPESLRKRVLEEIHSAHAGVVRMKSVARGFVWWPNLDEDIEQMCANCNDCQENRRSPPQAPLHPWAFPERPWQRLHLDFAGPFMGVNFLVIVDAHSKWPEVTILTSTTSTKTIQFLRSTFARFGLPEQIVTDNGAQFVSQEFQEFLQMNGIKHFRSAPYHPSTNGLAERFIQTMKGALKKNVDRCIHQKLEEFLLRYRNTAHATTKETPAKLLQNRDLRTRLDLIRPSVGEVVRESQTKQVLYRQETARDRDFHDGDRVYVRDYRQGVPKWIKGTLANQTGPVSFQVETIQGGKWKRHQDQIRRVPWQLPVCDSKGVIEKPGPELPVPVPVSVSPPASDFLRKSTCASSGVLDKSGFSVMKDTNIQETPKHRYPKRVCKKPKRLNI